MTSAAISHRDCGGSPASLSMLADVQGRRDGQGMSVCPFRSDILNRIAQLILHFRDRMDVHSQSVTSCMDLGVRMGLSLLTCL